MVVQVYKNKDDIRNCTNYHRIKCMSHTTKLSERLADQRLRQVTNISENQFDFVPYGSTSKAIILHIDNCGKM